MLRKLADWSNLAAAAGLGLYLLLLALLPPAAARRVAAAPGAARGAWVLWAPALAAGAWLIGINGRLVAGAWRAGGLRERLRLPAGDGAHLFSPEALEELFLRALRAEPDLADPGAALEVRPGPALTVHLRFGLKEQEDIVRRMEEIRALVRGRLQRLIPAGVGLEVNVEVVEFTPPAGPPPRGEGGGFNGPVYADGPPAAG